MNLIDPKIVAADEYNRLQIKHLKARTQAWEAVSILLVLVVFLAFLAPFVALIAWLR